MENQQYVRIFVLLLALWPALVFGYDNDFTHPLLTNEAIKLFGQDYSGKLSGSDSQSIVQGSKDEDNIPRWLEHFYDPINNRGLNAGQFATSKQWAHGQNITGNDYSWENAIYEYAYGDRQKGLYALGHIVHLVQDATVPDHTRDDVHVMVKTYEAYAENQKFVPASTPIYINSLDDYFDQAANFSNNNFFSDDTILNYYNSPQVEKENWEKTSRGVEVNFGLGTFGRLVLIKRFRDSQGVLHTEYSLDDTDNKVMSDYWNTLAPKAVGYSAGVIKLFFDEVEKEKLNGTLKKARMPWWEKLLELAKVRVDQILGSAIFSVGNNREDDDPVTPSSKMTPSIDVPPSVGEDEIELIPEENIPKTKQEQLAELEAKLRRLRKEMDEISGQGEQIIIPVIHSVNSVLSLVGVGVLETEAPTTTATTTVTIISPPVVTSPEDFSLVFATSSLTFSGKASSGLTIFNDFDGTEATANENEDWSLTLSDLVQGLNEIKFYTRDEEGNTSLPFEVSFVVDALPLAVDFSISNCDRSLSPDFCLLKPTSTLSFVWSLTKPGDYQYDLMKETYYRGEWTWEKIETISDLETTTETGLGGSDLLKEFNWQILVHNASSSEIIASSSIVTTTFHPRPIVINEIGWAGTTASPLDEWIELKNYLRDYQLSLVGYYLTDTNKTWQINLDGSILPSGYYLIERGSDEVVSNRQAKLIDNFISDANAKAFDLQNVGLKLWRKVGEEEELVDETPTWDKASSPSSSLERTWEHEISVDLSTWEDNTGCNESDGPCALDRNASTTLGTPGVINSASIPRLW